MKKLIVVAVLLVGSHVFASNIPKDSGSLGRCTGKVADQAITNVLAKSIGGAKVDQWGFDSMELKKSEDGLLYYVKLRAASINGAALFAYEASLVFPYGQANLKNGDCFIQMREIK